MHAIPAFKPAYFVALFVDASTGVPKDLSAAPTLVGKSIAPWGLDDWFAETMVGVAGATGAYVCTPSSYISYGDFGYMAWPQWADQSVRLAFFGTPIYGLTELTFLDAAVSSRLDASAYVASPSTAELAAAILDAELPAPGETSVAAGLAGLVEALLGWTSESGVVSGSVALPAHSCQVNNSELTATNTPNVTRCGGYCNMEAFLWFTLSGPLVGVTAGLLDIYLANPSGSLLLKIELSADPDDPSTTPTVEGRTFSSAIELTGLQEGAHQIDITSLLVELNAAAPGGSALAVHIRAADVYSGAGVNTFEAGHEAALTIDYAASTPQPAEALLGSGAGSGVGYYSDTILGGQDEPLDGVRVQLSTDAAGRHRVYEATTNALGEFEMWPDPGAYYRWLDLAGHRFTQGVQVDVEEMET